MEHSKVIDTLETYHPPTLDLFWGQYNLCMWKSLPSAEKARQVAFKKEMAEEEASYQAAYEVHDAA